MTQNETVWTILRVLVRYIIALTILSVLATQIRAATPDQERCYDFGQKVLDAQAMQLTDKRPFVIIKARFMRTTPGIPDDANIAWNFAMSRMRVDFRLLVDDASSQCETMGFGYMHEVYTEDKLRDIPRKIISHIR